MSTIAASPQTRLKSLESSKSRHLAQIQTSAAQLATTIVSFTKDDPKSARSENRVRSFTKVYASLGKAIPESRRLELFLEMKNALANIIEETEANSATVINASKAQQENEAFMSELRNQEQALRAQDIAAKKLLSSVEMRERLSFTPQALSAAVRAKRMFVLTGPSGESFYPAFFADARYDRRDLEKISKALGGLSGGSKWGFFTTAKISLENNTPLDALAKGKLDAVLLAAAGFLDA